MHTERVFHVSGVPETEHIARWWGERAEPGLLFDLRGTLGAGKTTFVRALARGMGVEHGVASPTFVICREYQGRIPLFHIDAYRLEDPEELLIHGWDDMVERGVVAVEWGERVSELLPDARVELNLVVVGESERRVEIKASGERPRDLLKACPAVGDPPSAS